MKTISSILAIAAIMATTDAMFRDLNQAFLNNLRSTYVDPNHGRSIAYTVNSDVFIRSFLRDEKSPTIILFGSEDPPQILPDPPRNHPICGSDLGVYIRQANQYFCKIISFNVEVVKDDSDEPREIRLILVFKKDGLPPLVLGVPVLKLPASAPQTVMELANWGRYYGVGTKPPFDSDKLADSEATKSLTINFRWLSDLLVFGVNEKLTPTMVPVPGGQPYEITAFITRPLLFPEELMVRSKQLIDALYNPNGESVGSNTILWNDNSEEEISSGL